jgi:hypothetical protein
MTINVADSNKITQELLVIDIEQEAVPRPMSDFTTTREIATVDSAILAYSSREDLS